MRKEKQSIQRDERGRERKGQRGIGRERMLHGASGGCYSYIFATPLCCCPNRSHVPYSKADYKANRHSNMSIDYMYMYSIGIVSRTPAESAKDKAYQEQSGDIFDMPKKLEYDSRAKLALSNASERQSSGAAKMTSGADGCLGYVPPSPHPPGCLGCVPPGVETHEENTGPVLRRTCPTTKKRT